MTLELKVAVHLLEGQTKPGTVLPTGKVATGEYVCIVAAEANGTVQTQYFEDGLNAIKYVEDLLRAWTNTAVQMKRDTIMERKHVGKTI